MASYKNGSITLENVYGKKTYETTIVDCSSSTELQELIITANGIYEAPTGTGYSPVKVNVKLEGNPLQYVIDNQGGDGVPSCQYIFYKYKGSNLDNLLSTLDFSKVTNMSNMFGDCKRLTTILQLDTSNVTNMYNMFGGCEKITSIPQLDTSSVTDMSSIFYFCTALTTIPQLDTSSVTNMSMMFYNCTNLTTIPQLDTSKVTNMSSMFSTCTNLTTIPQLDTSKVTNMSNFVSYCKKLTTIPQLDTSKVTEFYNMFYNCTSLTSIGIYGFTRSIDISKTALQHDAIVAFLNQAGTAYDSSQKITMGSTKLALLSDEEKAIAINKGWTLA